MPRALCALLMLALPLLATPALRADVDNARQQSTRDLGNQLCAGYAEGCGKVWRLGMERGEPFNRLIADTCLWIWVNKNNSDHGIACAESAIRAVPTLPDSVLVYGQFAPGEREQHEFWGRQPDRQWALSAARLIGRIPARCDQLTPVIYDYLPCLLREVQGFHFVLKKYRRFWVVQPS